MRLIVGLGNPGRAYARNRHNVGFLCLDHFAQQHRIALKERRFYARFGMGEVAGQQLVLAKPLTYMNRSGQSMARLVQHLGPSQDEILVIYDDMDLTLGRIRLRERGSAGGHKGMNSIIDTLGTREIPRIRVGIGRPAELGETKRLWSRDYVLGDFTPEEWPILEEVRSRVAEAILCLLTQGMAAAMNRFN